MSDTQQSTFDQQMAALTRFRVTPEQAAGMRDAMAAFEESVRRVGVAARTGLDAALREFERRMRGDSRSAPILDTITLANDEQPRR